MNVSIHGHLEKIRFHISQKILENFEDFFTLFFRFSPQNSILRLHTNLLTDIDMQKWREKLFSYQPLTKPFLNGFVKEFSYKFFSLFLFVTNLNFVFALIYRLT